MKRRKPAPRPMPRPLPSPTPKPDVSILPVPNYDAAMARQVYQNLLAQSLQQAALFNDYINQGMGVNNALTAATSGQTIGTMPTQTIGTIPQQPVPIQMPTPQGGQQMPQFGQQFGQVNQQGMQNFNNLLQNGISQANANQGNPGDIYRSLQPVYSPNTRPQVGGTLGSAFGSNIPKFSF